LAKLKALLLMGGPDYHNEVFHFAELAGILSGEAGVDLRITDDLDVLNPDTLAQYQVLINWSTFVNPTPEQVQALLDAIDGGLGFLGLHGATTTFWNSAPYLNMIGSRFLRHDPYKKFLVEISSEAHPITHGISDFEVEDELYELGGDVSQFHILAESVQQGRPFSETATVGEGPLQPGIKVLASAEGHPLLYSKTYGRGRIHYNALGHDTKALSNPNYRKLVIQALNWVAPEAA
jgi:type 1 glutamine amidotransferase